MHCQYLIIYDWIYSLLSATKNKDFMFRQISCHTDKNLVHLTKILNHILCWSYGQTILLLFDRTYWCKAFAKFWLTKKTPAMHNIRSDNKHSSCLVGNQTRSYNGTRVRRKQVGKAMWQVINNELLSNHQRPLRTSRQSQSPFNTFSVGIRWSTYLWASYKAQC